MRSSSGCTGDRPAASIAASSMPAAKKSPTFCSMLPCGHSPAAAALAISCCTCSERSPSAGKAPQVVRSPGTGLAASHLPFTKPLKSWQASMLVSMSSAFSEIGCCPTFARSICSAGAAGAVSVAAVSAGAWSRWQADRARLADSARTSGLVRIMGEASVRGTKLPSLGHAQAARVGQRSGKGGWRRPRPPATVGALVLDSHAHEAPSPDPQPRRWSVPTPVS